jgi:hypothetical protein
MIKENSAMKATTKGVIEQLKQQLKTDLYRLASHDLKKYLISPQTYKNDMNISGIVYLEQIMLRLDDHFDLFTDLLIIDDHHGTLGFVYLFDTSTSTEEAQTFIDSAAYANHLLLNHLDAEDKQAWAIEVTIVLPEESVEALKRTLHSIVRETTFLHAIGISLLPYRDEGSFSNGAIRRAFPWLLQDATSWYKKSGKSGDKGPQQPLTAIELNNYRLSGQRRLNLDNNTGIHLLHGHNGSGKSSITEALELSLTNGIDRVPDSKITATVRHNGQGSAKVMLLSDEKTLYETTITKESYSQLSPKPDDNRLTTGSFRLDQDAMDRLSRRNSSERSSTFLESFFPDDAPLVRACHKAKMEKNQAHDKLPKKLQKWLKKQVKKDASPESAIEQRWGWLSNSNAQSRDRDYTDLLPLPVETLNTLTALIPTIEELVARIKESSLTLNKHYSLLQAVDDELTKTARDSPRISTSLSQAKELLIYLGKWELEGTKGVSESEYLKALNQWVENAVLLDLTEKQLHISNTISLANSQNWTASGESKTFFQDRQHQTIDRRYLTELIRSAKEKQELLRPQLSPEKSQQVEEVGGIFSLMKRERELLNLVGSWLPMSLTTPTSQQLGDTIDDALKAKKNEQKFAFGKSHIGTPHWAQPLLDEISQLEETISSLSSAAQEDLGVSILGRLNTLKGLVDSQRAFSEKSKMITGTFLDYIRQNEPMTGEESGNNNLNEAINELMALFTPTRWNYEDLDLTYNTDDKGKDAIAMKSGDCEDVDLRLNTAELNLFTIALFLLCAVRQDNPIRLLILDDPLQNMDELTSTTLARGLARLKRLWDRVGLKDWSMMFLFHGEDDLERFRQELPCAVYLLPTSTVNNKAELEINMNEKLSRTCNELQPLGGVISIT